MPPRRFPLLLALLAAALFVSACGSGDDDADTATDAGPSDPTDEDDGGAAGDAAGGGATRPWIAGSWVLESATGDAGPLTLPAGTAIELSIAGPDSIDGGAGCNSFGGRIEAPFDGDDDAGSLSISEVFATEIACEHLDFEVAYLDLLNRVTEWELAPPSGLVFRGDGIELVYAGAAPPVQLSLEGPTWIFDTIFDGPGMERTASSTRLDKPEVIATVTSGVLTLSTEGCDPIEVAVGYEPGANHGPFTVEDPGSLAERIDCADPESNLVAAVDGVAQSSGYQIVDGRLTLVGQPGETVSFRAEES